MQLLHGNGVGAVGEADAVKRSQRADRLAGDRRVLPLRHPADGVERIIEKMLVDLRAEQLQLKALLADLTDVVFLDQMRNAGVHLVEAVVDLLNFAAPLVRQADGKIAVFRPAHFLRESCDRLYRQTERSGSRPAMRCRIRSRTQAIAASCTKNHTAIIARTASAGRRWSGYCPAAGVSEPFTAHICARRCARSGRRRLAASSSM